jgi:hypothetical protein
MISAGDGDGPDRHVFTVNSLGFTTVRGMARV